MVGKKKWKKFIGSLLSFVFIFTMLFPLGTGQALETESNLETTAAFEDTSLANDEETTSADSIIVEPSTRIITPQEESPGEVIVKYKEGKEKQAESALAVMGIQEVEQSDSGISLYTLQSGEDMAQVVEKLEQNPAVEYAEPNQEYTLFSDVSIQGITTDEYFEQQWALKNIKAEEAWGKVKELSGTVTVAVIDTGVDDNHPDLAGRILQGKNFAERKSDGTLYPENRDSRDDNGHGTQVAGIISALYNNQKGITGAAGSADVKIYPVKVMHDKGSGSTFDIASGIQHAADQGVDIINLSLGGNYSKAIEHAVTYAQNRGILVVAAAGNAATNVDAVYPAALPDVLTVGAITQDKDKIADFSNQGSSLDIVAPGADVITTTIKEKGTLGDDSNGYYAKVSGTSFAAPYAAAVAALYKLKNPEADALDIAYTMTAAASDLGASGRDNTYGYGKLNAAKTLDPLTDPEQRPAIQILEPTKDGYVMGEVSIQARVSGETVNTVRFYLGEVNEEKLIAFVDKQGEQTLYHTNWDTKKIADGSYTVWAVASNGQMEIGRTSVPVIVNNSPKNGLMLNVLDPEGNKAPGAKVSIYTKAPVSQEEAPVPSTTAPYTYKLLWSGSTDSLGVTRVPGTIVTDLTTISVVVHGGFDYANAAEGNTVFLYNQTVEGPGVFTIRGEETVPVTFNTLGENQKKLGNTKYFATLLDDNGITVGTTTALNEDESTISTVFMNKAKYNLFAYNKAAEATYFLYEKAKQIVHSTTVVFDGSKAGEVGLAPGNDENKIVNGILYLFNEGTDETIGINDEALVGRKLRVTPGSYDFWADVEVKDPAGGQNWIYVFGTGENGERLVEVPANGKASIPVGGKLALTEFAPDVEELKSQLKKMGKEYVPQENEFTIQKSSDYFYTKQKFTDAYGNLLVGMYRGSLEGSGLWQKQNMNGETPAVSRLDEQSNTWQTQEYYFGNIYPNFKVTRKADGFKIYNNNFRQFYYWAFWAVVLPTVTPGKYDVQLTLQNNPLAGKELTAGMENTVKDDRKYKTIKTTLNDKPFAATVTIYQSAEEEGEMVWEKSFSGKANATTGEVAIENNIKLSNKKNGNLAKVIYILTDKEYGDTNKGEYLLAFRPFTTLEELQDIKLANMQRVEISAQGKDGKVIENRVRRDRGVIFPGHVEGKEAPFYQFTGNDYKKEGVWLEPGTYHFDGHYIIGAEEGKKLNYYLFKKNVFVTGSQGAVNRVLLDGTNTAKIAFAPDTAGYHDFRGVSLFPFNPYRHEMNELNTVGHTFYLAADLPYHIDTKLTLGDKENPVYTWNYFLEEAKEQSFARGEEKIWRIGKFVPQLLLDKTTMKGTEAVTGRSGIMDEHGNRVVYTFIDEDDSWSAAVDEEEEQRPLAIRLQANGQVKVSGDIEYSVSHEETKPIGPSVTEINPYLRVYKKQADGKETRIFNESKAVYYEGFNELLGNLQSGNYRAEVAFASSPNGPMTTTTQDGAFIVPAQTQSGSDGSGDSGSGGGGGSVQPTPTPVKGETKSISDNQLNQAVENALTNNASVIRIETDKSAAVSLTINQLKAIKDTKKALEITFNNVTFTIPSAVLVGLPLKAAANIEFSATALSEADAKNVTDAAENAAMVKKVVGTIFKLRVTAITEAGEAVGIKTFTNQLQVNLPVPKEEQAAALSGQIHAHRFNPDTKRWDFIGGTYHPVTNTISFTTSKFSRFALLITDEVMQIFDLTDLKGHWAEEDIQFMVNRGYVKGIGDGKFAPNSLITRAEFAAMMTRILGLKEDASAARIFKDLNPNHWAYGSVQAAAKAGLISGYEDGQFNPEQKITRQEISALMIRALKYKEVKNEISDAETAQVLRKFKDHKEISLWAKKDVTLAVKAGIVAGRSNDEYAPRANATRAEGTVLLKRALEKTRN